MYMLFKRWPLVYIKYIVRGESWVAIIARGEAECYLPLDLTKSCIFHTNGRAVL